MAERIAIFGGAFDPPHLGHQAACLYLLTTSEVDSVWWVPSLVHAFGKQMAPFEDRVAMCRLAVRHFDPARVLVSTVERDLPPPQCTVDTVDHLARQRPDRQLRVAIGSDNLDELARWKEIDRLRVLAPLLVVPRTGEIRAAAARPLLPQVASSEIRNRIAEGGDPRPFVDDAVAHFISERGLYRDRDGGAT
ncbi:MAG: nicotinate-nicotinamide nucleotide adenylyltransferase [Deltaproteobacteria bacterium]|nr:nicotinate-nicotinamide nucleotide adenylyltransferase [Deltaproteobacteria bacterium]